MMHLPIHVFHVNLLHMLWRPPNVALAETSKEWSLVTLGSTRAPKGISPLACNERNSKLLNLLLIDHYLLLKFHALVTFAWDNYYADCTVIGNVWKIFPNLAEGIMTLILGGQCMATDCVKPKTDTHTSLWSYQKRQDKPLSKHAREHRWWSTWVAYRGCRGEDSNS